MRSLILGAGGLIGTHLERQLSTRKFAKVGTCYRKAGHGHIPLDTRDAQGVQLLIADHEPEVVYFAAGSADAGWCEQHAEECRAILVRGVSTAARAAAACGSRFVLFTSGEVYGAKRGAGLESDALAPTSVLGRAQADAEEAVRSLLPSTHLILRSQWVFGSAAGSRCRVGTWLRRLARQDTVNASTSLEGNPTFAGDLAETSVELTRLGETGTINVVGPDRHTEFTFARQLAHLHGFDVDRVEIDRDSTGPSTRLDRKKLRDLLGPHAVRSTADGLRTGLRRAVVAA